MADSASTHHLRPDDKKRVNEADRSHWGDLLGTHLSREKGAREERARVEWRYHMAKHPEVTLPVPVGMPFTDGLVGSQKLEVSCPCISFLQGGLNLGMQ